jgi:hypothetical protein
LITLPLTFNLIAFLETLDTAGGIHDTPLAGKERMAFTADLHLKFFFGGTGGERVATGTYHYGVLIKFGVNLFFHIIQLE